MTSCIFTVIKNEQEYLEDFIKYHLDLGVNHIFIFEDKDSESHKNICNKYQNVTLNNVDILKPIEYNQKEYIKSGLIWIRDNYKYDWCFSIDCDEFITVTEEFPKLLEDYLNNDAIMLQWKNFGYSGHIEKPIYDKPIWEIYDKECGFTKNDKKYCNCTKMCFNMNKLQEKFIFGNHTALCNYVKPDFTWDRTKPIYSKIYLRHYITKSFEEYVWKLKIRGMMCPEHRGYNDFFEMHPELENKRDELIKFIEHKLNI